MILSAILVFFVKLHSRSEPNTCFVRKHRQFCTQRTFVTHNGSKPSNTRGKLPAESRQDPNPVEIRLTVMRIHDSMVGWLRISADPLLQMLTHEALLFYCCVGPNCRKSYSSSWNSGANTMRAPLIRRVSSLIWFVLSHEMIHAWDRSVITSCLDGTEPFMHDC